MYYLKKTTFPIKNSRLLVYFLWFIVFTELFGSYAPIAYYSEYRIFGFVENTAFQNNMWWYNIISIINFSFCTYYFSSFLRSDRLKFIFNSAIVIYLVVAVIYYGFSGEFYTESTGIMGIVGVLLLLISILVFYYQLLRSDLILTLKHFLPFYISIGVLFFNLIVTPIELLSEFLTVGESNVLFVELYINVLQIANIILYLSFIFGFIICSKKR